MAEDRFARTVRDWLTAAAPTEAPDRILDAVAARVDELEQPARRRWPGTVAMAAIVSAIVILGGAAIFAGISRIGSPSPAPSSVSATPSSIRCDAAPCSLNLVEGTLYVSSAFDPPVIMRAPSDRWLVDHDEPGRLRLVVGGDERRNVTFLLDPRPTDPLGLPDAADVAGAEAFTRWLQDRAALDVSTPVEVALGGLRGWVVDVRGAAPFPDRSEGCVTEGACAAVFAYSVRGEERVYGVASVDVIRLYLLDDVDHLVVIAVEARHSAPIGFLDGEAQDLLETLELAGSRNGSSRPRHLPEQRRTPSVTNLQSTATRRLSPAIVAIVLTACGTTAVPPPQTASPEEATATPSPRPTASPVETGPVAEPFEVTVGGLQIAGHCTGSRPDGSPAVILQPGNGGNDEHMAAIKQHLAERTIVCIYSRPGAGSSDAPADLPRPVSAVVTEMHGVLEALDIAPPYFAIGGSAGAVVAFMFAQAYPDEVAGLVFMNGNPPYDSWVAMAAAMGLHQGMVDGAEADFTGDNPERIDFRANESMLTTPLPASLPYAVMYDENYSFDPNLRDFQEAEAALYERLATVGEGGRFIWARGAGHDIHLALPDLVNDTIDEVWAEATD